MEEIIREIRKVTDDPDIIEWVRDGNVVLAGGAYRTQDAQYRNKLVGEVSLVAYYNRELKN